MRQMNRTVLLDPGHESSVSSQAPCVCRGRLQCEMEVTAQQMGRQTHQECIRNISSNFGKPWVTGNSYGSLSLANHNLEFDSGISMLGSQISNPTPGTN